MFKHFCHLGKLLLFHVLKHEYKSNLMFVLFHHVLVVRCLMLIFSEIVYVQQEDECQGLLPSMRQFLAESFLSYSPLPFQAKSTQS